MDFRRQTLAGSPTQASSNASPAVIVPLGGFAPQGNEFLQPPDSFASGQNVWVRNGSLEPRWRLSNQSIGRLPLGSGITKTTSSGTLLCGVNYVDLLNVSSGFAPKTPGWLAAVNNFGSGTSFYFSFFDTATSTISWKRLSSVTAREFTGSLASTGGAGLLVQPSHFTDSNLRGALVYDAANNANVYVFTLSYPLASGQSRGLYIFTGTSKDSTSPMFSALSGATPDCATDLTNFADRVVAWNVNNIPTRAQWHSEGDVTDWTGLGSGYQDLNDMRGFGTRIFSQAEQLVLTSTEEIWRGRTVGLPYIFNFSPIERRIGVPYMRASIQTPYGIFWLGRNFTIYQMVGEQITELTQLTPGLQDYLRTHLRAPDVAFFTYNADINQVRLWYSAGDNEYPSQSVAYSIDNKTWSYESYGHYMQCGIGDPLVYLTSASSAGGAAFIFGSGQNLGVFSAVFSSAGTVGAFTESAASEWGGNVIEDVTFGPIDAAPFRKETLVEARYDFGARSASSVTASWSSDFGKTAGVSQALSIASESHSSQVITYPKYTAQNLSLKLQSTNGNWQLRRITTVTQDDGRAN